MKAALICIASLAPVFGQAITMNDFAFQALGNPVLQGVHVLDEGFSNRVIKNKPFAATEERHSLQTLGDGTRIENMQTNRLFRDAEGRTRVEEMNGTVSIYDPTSGTRVQLDPATKTARKGGSGFVYGYNTSSYGALNLNTYAGYSNGILSALTKNPSNMQGVMSETTENLGTQAVNGVNASGVRTTMVIPKGQIGNNKDIKVMTERWSSNDLQMLVKSINSDPRFGDTTYQLTKITQTAPDPALFQVPSDYNLIEQPQARAGKVTVTPGAVGRGRGAGIGAAPGPAPVLKNLE